MDKSILKTLVFAMKRPKVVIVQVDNDSEGKVEFPARFAATMSRIYQQKTPEPHENPDVARVLKWAYMIPRWGGNKGCLNRSTLLSPC